MAGGYQGFVVTRNLDETIDRNALNNLGGSPIADDLALFDNNGRNFSSIDVTIENINSTTNYISFTDKKIVFTNGTKVSLNDTAVYYIKNSNGENEFQLSLNSNLNDTVQLDPSFVGTYKRYNEITFENITNYNKERRPALGSIPAGLNQSIKPFDSNPITDLFNAEQNVVKFRNRKDNSLISDQNFKADANFLMEGYTLIVDPDGVNNNNLTKNTGPGVFIYNINNDTKIRAFSDAQNVWVPNAGNTFLETTAKKITIGQLTLQYDTTTIQQKSGTTSNIVIKATTNSAITNTVFNFKTKVIINDEEYYICLSNSAVVT